MVWSSDQRRVTSHLRIPWKESQDSQVNYLFSSFEKYKKEIDSGKLKWGFLHTSEFWEDHFRDFEYKDFEYIRLLTEIIKAPQIRDADLDKKCIACYDLGEFAKFYPGGSAVVNQLGAKEHLLELIQHENLELKNRALVCLQKIMMRTTKKWNLKDIRRYN